MVEELAHTSAIDLAGMVSARQISPVELCEYFLARIERIDPEVGAVVTLAADAALATAAAQAELAGAADAPPFLGVPMLIKDLHLTAGMRTTFGTSSLAGFVPSFDEENVARIRRAGFVILGKTNVPEFGTVAYTESALLGPCRNPWDPARTPGGSAGGAAAAVAARLVPVAHGSDGAGSIRIPASNCGVFGLKPTRGRVSNAPLFGDAVVSLSTVGPLARSVEDAAGLLDVMRGYAAGDPHWAPEPVRPFRYEARADPGQLRIGLVTQAPWATFDAASLHALDEAAAVLSGLGHVVEPAVLPLDGGLQQEFEVVYSAALAATPVDPATLEPFNAGLSGMGHQVAGPRLLQAIASLQMHSRLVVGACMAYDMVAWPTLTRAPLKIGELAEMPTGEQLRTLAAYVGLTPLANVTGQPSMSCPLAWSPEGLPAGICFTGRPADEATLFRLAGQLERATGWTDRRPPIA